MNHESDSNQEFTVNEEVELISDNQDVIEEEQDTVNLMGIFIRDKSYEGHLTNAEDFLDEPFSLDVDEVLLKIDELKIREEFSDISIRRGKEKIYLYSRDYITSKYMKEVALLLFLFLKIIV